MCFIQLEYGDIVIGAEQAPHGFDPIIERHAVSISPIPLIAADDYESVPIFSFSPDDLFKVPYMTRGEGAEINS
jgi:hypothetical protein